MKAGRLSRGEPSPEVTNPTEPALRLQVIQNDDYASPMRIKNGDNMFNDLYSKKDA